MKDQSSEKELFEHCPVPKAIFKLALPTVIGQIILVVYNMADTFFIGLTGSDAMITAVTVCMPAFMFLSAISNLFGVGGASVISRALGKHSPERARHTAAFALWGCIAVTLLYSLAAYLMRDTFINLLGGSDPTVHAYAVEYLVCTVVLGGFCTAMNTLLAHLIRAEGHSLQSSVGITLGGIFNMALDPLFMFVILPRGQETLGAAIATALSNVLATGYFVWVIARNRDRSVMRFAPSRRMLDDRIPADVMSTGLPACLMTLFENISYAVLDNLMSLAGTAMQAGIGVAKKVNMLAHCIVRGMAQGVLPLIGYNFASGDHKRMKKAAFTAAMVSVALALVCMAVCLGFSAQLIGLFIQHGSESVSAGASFLRILCIGGPFSAFAYMVVSFFQATGHGGKSLLLALMRKGMVDIPLMFALGALFPMYGLVWATPASDVICCIAAAAMFALFLRQLDRAPQPSPLCVTEKAARSAAAH